MQPNYGHEAGLPKCEDPAGENSPTGLCGSIIMAKSYDASNPDIRAVVSDAVFYLNGDRN